MEVCIDNCLMPSGVFDIAGGVVSLRSLRRREETGVRFRARRPRKMWTRDDMNILSQFNPQTKLPPPRIPTEEERGWDRSWSAEESEAEFGCSRSRATSDVSKVFQHHSETAKLRSMSLSLLNLEKIRKRVAKRTLEAHDLMLRSYYAVKFSSSSSVDFSRLLGNSFALQHCLRLPI